MSACYGLVVLRETKGAWSVACDRCHAVAELVATSLEEGVAVARRAGWLDQARKGKRLEQRAWLCPKCRPGDASGKFGRST